MSINSLATQPPGTASGRTGRAIRGTVASFVQIGLQILLQMALAPLVLNVAGQETLGAYAILTQAIGYLSLTDLGFSVAINRYLSQSVGWDEPDRFDTVLVTGKTVALVTNTVFALAALVLSLWIGDLFALHGAVEQQARIALWLLATWSVIRTPLGVYGLALAATQHLAGVNLINVVSVVVRLLASLGLVAAGAGLVGLMVANICAEASTFLVHRWYYRRVCPKDSWGWGIPDRRLLGEMVWFGARYYLSSIASRMVFSTDNLIVGTLHGAAAVSAYYTTQMPTFLLFSLVWKLADNSAPAMNELYARQAFDHLRTAYVRLVRYSLLLVLGLAAGVLIFNRYLVVLWTGEQQYAGGIMTVALAVFAIATVINHVNAGVMVSYGEVRWLSIVGIVGGVVNVALSMWWGLLIGSQGVMVASAVVECLASLVLGAFALRLVRTSGWKLCQSAVIPAIAAVSFVLPLAVAWLVWPPAFTWGALMLWAGGFLAMWGLGAVAAGLTRSEMRELWVSLRLRPIVNG